jgi:DNA-directed RNA polymerase specialized sigma24 family protein
MKIPNGMTEESVLEQIKIVVDRISPKYTFHGFAVEDVKQEAYIICIKALDRYDGVRPLENFLSYNLSRRLINLIRDNLFLKDDNEEKKRIAVPGQLSGETYNGYYFDSQVDAVDFKHLAEEIDKTLPPIYRADYLKLINGVHVPKKQKEELIEIIKIIAHEAGYREED